MPCCEAVKKKAVHMLLIPAPIGEKWSIFLFLTHMHILFLSLTNKQTNKQTNTHTQTNNLYGAGSFLRR
jgi:hypothetical protein